MAEAVLHISDPRIMHPYRTIHFLLMIGFRKEQSPGKDAWRRLLVRPNGGAMWGLSRLTQCNSEVQKRGLCGS